MTANNFKWWMISKADLNKENQEIQEYLWDTSHQIKNYVSTIILNYTQKKDPYSFNRKITSTQEVENNLIEYYRNIENNNEDYLLELEEAIDSKDFKKIHECISLLASIFTKDEYDNWYLESVISDYDRYTLHEMVNLFEIQSRIDKWEKLKYWLFKRWECWVENFNCNWEDNMWVGFTFDPIINEYSINWEDDYINNIFNLKEEYIIDLDSEEDEWLSTDEDEFAGVINQYIKYNWEIYFVRNSCSWSTSYVKKLTKTWDKYTQEYVNVNIVFDERWYYKLDFSHINNSLEDEFNNIKYDDINIPNPDLFKLIKKLNPKIQNNTSEDFYHISWYEEALQENKHNPYKILKAMWVPSEQIKLLEKYYDINYILNNPDEALRFRPAPTEYTDVFEVEKGNKINNKLIYINQLTLQRAHDFKVGLYGQWYYQDGDEYANWILNKKNLDQLWEKQRINWKEYYIDWKIWIEINPKNKYLKFVYVDENQNIIENPRELWEMLRDQIRLQITNEKILELIEEKN